MANRIILITLSSLYVILCIFCILERRHRANQTVKAVYLPEYMLWIGVFGSGLFLAFAWFAARQEGSIGLTICFGLFALLGMSLMLGWKNCFIAYDKTGFTQKNLLGMKRSYTYGQVSAWRCNKRNPIESALYTDGKKITFNLLSSNGPDFLIAVSAGYRKTHGRKKLPELPALRKEKGGFCAHVYNPGEYLAIFLLMLVFIVGLGAWIIIHDLQPIHESDAEHYALTFSSWEVQEDRLVLTTPQMQEPFIVYGCKDHLSNFQQLIKNCNGKETFSVWAKRIVPDDKVPFFQIHALSSEESIYRTFEDSTAYKREALPFSIAIFSFFLFIFLIFSAFIYIVGSNPQKFPKWVVYCCFKHDAIDL